MRSQLALYILVTLAASCMAEEAACTAAEDENDDRCILLQGNVGISKDHAVAHAKSLEHAAVEAKSVEHGWPDIFKKVKDVLGGADALEKDFGAVVAAAATFKDDVHKDVKALLASVDSSSSIEQIQSKVEETYNQIHRGASKLQASFDKVTQTWLNGVGKVAPKQLQNAMMSILGKVNAEGKAFADSFTAASKELKKINRTEVCAKVKEGLHKILHQASGLAKGANGLSTKGLSKDIKAARDALPDALKKEIEKMLKSAEKAADGILGKLTPAMKEVTHGVAKAFGDHCTGLPHSGAGRLQVGLLVLLSVVSFFM